GNGWKVPYRQFLPLSRSSAHHGPAARLSVYRASRASRRPSTRASIVIAIAATPMAPITRNEIHPALLARSSILNMAPPRRLSDKPPDGPRRDAHSRARFASAILSLRARCNARMNDRRLLLCTLHQRPIGKRARRHHVGGRRTPPTTLPMSTKFVELKAFSCRRESSS